MITPITIASSIAALGLIATLSSKLTWRRRAVIGGLIVASVGSLAVGWPSKAPQKDQRDRVSYFCREVSADLNSLQGFLRAGPQLGASVVRDGEVEWRDTMQAVVIHAAPLCVPDPETCKPYVVIPVGITSPFMHSLDVLMDAFQHQRSCPRLEAS